MATPPICCHVHGKAEDVSSAVRVTGHRAMEPAVPVWARPRTMCVLGPGTHVYFAVNVVAESTCAAPLGRVWLVPKPQISPTAKQAVQFSEWEPPVPTPPPRITSAKHHHVVLAFTTVKKLRPRLQSPLLRDGGLEANSPLQNAFGERINCARNSGITHSPSSSVV